MAIFRKKYTKALPADAEMFEKEGQQFARWVDRNGRKREAPVFETKTGARRVRLETTTLTVKYRDAAGVVREERTGCKTASAAQSVQTELRRRQELIRAGVITAAQADVSNHATAAIADHIGAYLAHLELDASPGHIAHVRHQLGRTVSECRFSRLADLNADRLEHWLGLCRREGLGARTRNTYRAAIHAFATWCVHSGRLLGNPFTRVPKADEKADARHMRRALTEKETRRLLLIARLRPVAELGREVEKTSPPPDLRKRSNWRWTALTPDNIAESAERGRAKLAPFPPQLARIERLGIERELIYRTLLQTGLRSGELASITIGQVDLDAVPCVLVLEAADEKNRQGSVIPLRDDLAAAIRSFIGGRELESSMPLFKVPKGLSSILNRDLRAAGISKRDARNRVVDVHAMRHTFGTNLSRAKVPFRTVQAAMRHSDPKLTANIYTDPVLLDVAGAVNALPSLPPMDREELKPVRAAGERTAGADGDGRAIARSA